MAYFSAERKAIVAPIVKAICKAYGVKATLSVRHHSTVVLKITKGPIDFIGSYNRMNTIDKCNSGHLTLNPYHYRDSFDGVALAFLDRVMDALNAWNWNKSDICSDYINVGWYVDVHIGHWANGLYSLDESMTKNDGYHEAA